MQLKHEAMTDENLFYCFVNFEPEFPTVHVMPAAVVAKVIKTAHQIWLDTPGKNGKPHKDTDMRRVSPVSPGTTPGWMDEYLENWELLAD